MGGTLKLIKFFSEIRIEKDKNYINYIFFYILF